MEIKQRDTPHKKADENKKWYYGPISILPVISKVCEKVLFDQICTAISPHFSSNLSGFLKGDSWCMALIIHRSLVYGFKLYH